MNLKIVAVVFSISISFILCNTCLAQDYATSDSIINKFILKLQNKKIDTICVYRSYYPGSFIIRKPGDDTSCNHSEYGSNTFFIWKSKGMTYLTLKNYCFDYDTISVTGEKFWGFYFSNKSILLKEKIKPFGTFAIINGKKEIQYHMIDHSARQEIDLIIKNKRLHLYFDSFDFEKDEDDGKTLNINYKYNVNTKAKKLQIILQGILNDVSKKKLLKKIKR